MTSKEVNKRLLSLKGGDHVLVREDIAGLAVWVRREIMYSNEESIYTEDEKEYKKVYDSTRERKIAPINSIEETPFWAYKILLNKFNMAQQVANRYCIVGTSISKLMQLSDDELNTLEAAAKLIDSINGY